MNNDKAIIPAIAGVVSNCKKLNIRKTPYKDADVVAVVPVGTKLKINVSSVGKEWYRVSTADGKVGFCMKDYVTIK